MNTNAPGNRRALATLGLIVLLLAVGLPLAVPAPVRAGVGTVFLVNSTLDPGAGGICNGTECSLREAIEAANANAGHDTINFNFAGTSPGAIAPTTALPVITDTVTINGYSEPDASENTTILATNGSNAVLMVILDGSALASGSGLTVDDTAPDSVIRGLVISDFPAVGINIDGDNVAIGRELHRDERRWDGRRRQRLPGYPRPHRGQRRDHWRRRASGSQSDRQ